MILQKNTANRLGIFVFYDKDGIADEYNFYFIEELKKQVYEANMELINLKKATDLFDDNWPIYTRTNDSCPTQYFDGSEVKSSVISNGCLIEGTIENSVIGRGCIIKEGAIVKNCVINADVVIGKGVHVENLVIDKHARLIRGKRVIAAPEKPGYIKRGDRL